MIPVTRSAPHSAGFDENAFKYKCCCGMMHVKTGALIIAVIELIFCLFVIGGSIIQSSVAKQGGSIASTIGGCLGSIIFLIILCLLFYAMFAEKSVFVVPHLVYQILVTICVVLWGILLILAAAGVTLVVGAVTKGSESVGGTVMGITLWLVIIFIIIFFIFALLEIWWFCIFVKLYRYYRDKERSQHGAGGSSDVHYGKDPVAKAIKYP